MGLAICSYFTPEDLRLAGIVDHLRRVQTPDGGWNCRWVNGSTHGSFHTKISVLEGLYEYGRSFAGRQADVDEMQAKGREFLLDHRLYRSHHTGKTSNAVFTRFSFPPQWHYDVLRGLDHFQAVDAPRDKRLADAIELVRSRRRPDDTWRLQNRHARQTWFEMERVGQPSRWNTLRALRVLRWWENM